jgi:hypothetical protein
MEAGGPGGGDAVARARPLLSPAERATYVRLAERASGWRLLLLATLSTAVYVALASTLPVGAAWLTRTAGWAVGAVGVGAGLVAGTYLLLRVGTPRLRNRWATAALFLPSFADLGAIQAAADDDAAFDAAARRLLVRTLGWGVAFLAALAYAASSVALAAGGAAGWYGDHATWGPRTLGERADEHVARAFVDLVPGIDVVGTVSWDRDPGRTADQGWVGMLTLGFKVVVAACVISMAVLAWKLSTDDEAWAKQRDAIGEGLEPSRGRKLWVRLLVWPHAGDAAG